MSTTSGFRLIHFEPTQPLFNVTHYDSVLPQTGSTVDLYSTLPARETRNTAIIKSPLERSYIHVVSSDTIDGYTQ